MIKKILVINFVLITLLYALPSQKLNLKENILPTSATCSEQVSVQVTSRSSEPRQDVAEVSPIAITYSDNCINLIKKYESFKGQAYLLDGETYWTIGYGHHGADVKKGQTITEEEAYRLLIAEVEGIKDYILKQDFEFNQNELDAMISFTYNCGLGNFNKLTKGRTKTEIAEHIEAYTNKGMKGLIKRRLEEKELFLKEV